MTIAPVDEPAKTNLLSPTTQAVLALVQGLLPPLTAIIGGIWVVMTYLDQQQDAHKKLAAQIDSEGQTRLLVARKSFNDQQFALYVQIAEIVSKLATLENYSSDEWTVNYRRFRELYWGALSMVEDDSVKGVMQEIRPQLEMINKDKTHVSDQMIDKLQQSSYSLATALKNSLEKTFGVTLTKRPSD